MDDFWALPPVARTWTALTFLTSCCVYGGVISGARLIFAPSYVFKLPVPELWRIFTSFCITGKGWEVLYDTYFLWTYSSTLEKESPRFTRPGDFFVYILFLGVFILATAGGIMGGYTFLSPMILALAYTYSQDNRRKKVNFFIIQLEAKWLPWAMLVAALVLGGPYTMIYQGTGIIAAHLYDFLTRLYPIFGEGRNYIQTPKIITQWFGGEVKRAQSKGFGTSFAPQAQQAARPSNGFSTAFSSPWSSRGQGRRLGGD